MDRYVIGLDFGTLTGRAVLARVSDGKIIAEAAEDYRHGVMDSCLPDGTRLPENFALADIGDYAEVLENTVRTVVGRANVPAEDIIGIGLDVTASTFVPVDADGEPLYLKKEYAANPHAWMKLWKHHHAQPQADRITQVMFDRKESFTARCGGKVNAEWMLPKLLEIYEEAPEIYAAADHFSECCDFLVEVLTGECTRSMGPWGYKMMKSEEDGTPDAAFYEALSPGFGRIGEKFKGKLLPLGACAGRLLPEIAKKLNLRAGIPVAAANMDAHVSFPSAGLTEPGQMLLILGTSCCATVMGTEMHPVPGAFGIVKDGLEPGYYGYEAGQSAVGDIYGWFVKNQLPARYEKEAEERGVSPHVLLTEKAEMLKPGQSGLIALDWWNGNRSVLADTRLSGMILGLTLQTKPEEIYRALLEATAYGLRVIIENFEENGVPVRELYACGGVAEKNRLLLRVIADVTGKPLRVSAAKESPALGSAMYGAAAAGEKNGGYADIFAAAKAMGHLKPEVYVPDPARQAVYEKLYREYSRLHDTFGRGENDVMKTLLELKQGL